jgi:nucleolar protein 56
MPSFWFGDCENEVCTPAPDDSIVLAKRVKALAGTADAPCPDWEMAVRCGLVEDREGYIRKIHDVAIAYSIERLHEDEPSDSSALVQMVRMLDQIDEVVNLLSERLAEWYQAEHPGFDIRSARNRKKPLIEILRNDANGSMLNIVDEISRLSDQRRNLPREVTVCAERVFPNSSALVGGLVVARLAAEAGTIGDLVKLPASSLQVLGAKKALFIHIATGCPPPKHGIIYQHGRVHGSAKDKRGRVARVISSKLAIALKIDYFRKETDHLFIKTAHEAVQKVRGSHDLG